MIASRHAFPSSGAADRLRRGPGLDIGSRFREGRSAALRRFHRYLSERLALPFTAYFHDSREGSACDHPVIAARLLPLTDDACPADGIECEIVVCGGAVIVPLGALRPEPHTINHQLIADYRFWLTNAR